MYYPVFKERYRTSLRRPTDSSAKEMDGAMHVFHSLQNGTKNIHLKTQWKWPRNRLVLARPFQWFRGLKMFSRTKCWSSSAKFISHLSARYDSDISSQVKLIDTYNCQALQPSDTYSVRQYVFPSFEICFVVGLGKIFRRDTTAITHENSTNYLVYLMPIE